MKKKLQLIACLTLGVMTANATNAYLYDFETPETTPVSITNAGYLIPESMAIIDNPVQTGINTSGKCYSIEAQSGIEWWGGVNMTLPQTTTNETVRYLYIQVLATSEFPSAFTISLFNNGGYTNITLSTTSPVTFSTEWKELCFKIDPGVTFSAVQCEPNRAGFFRIDNIRLSDVAPVMPVIPDIQPFSMNFESQSILNWSGSSSEATIYVAPTNESPYTLSTVLNSSSYCLRSWVGNGNSGAGPMYKNVPGVTNAQARYLHVRYFFLSNEDHPTEYYQPLRVYAQPNATPYSSTSNIRSEWHDVTIDLGIGTIVNSLTFNINDYWTTTGIDDVQLDGNPIRENIATGFNKIESALTFTPQQAGVLIHNVTGKTNIFVYNLTGILLTHSEVNSATIIGLNKGLYIIKAVDSKGSIDKKILIN